MNLTSERWRTLYRSSAADWSAATFVCCTADELVAMCKLMGIAHSGTNQERVARLLDMASLRVEVGQWGEFQGVASNAHALAAEVVKHYRKPQLLALARRANLFISTTKVGLVIGLLQWRDGCRMRGAEFDEQLRSSTKQLRMF
jgi:hypothetical protein